MIRLAWSTPLQTFATERATKQGTFRFFHFSFKTSRDAEQTSSHFQNRVWFGTHKVQMLWHLAGMPLTLPNHRGTMFHPDRLLPCQRINCQRQEELAKPSIHFFLTSVTVCHQDTLKHNEVYLTVTSSCLLPHIFNSGILTASCTEPESLQASAFLSPWIPLRLLHSMSRWTNCNNGSWAILQKCRRELLVTTVSYWGISV